MEQTCNKELTMSYWLCDLNTIPILGFKSFFLQPTHLIPVWVMGMGNSGTQCTKGKLNILKSW